MRSLKRTTRPAVHTKKAAKDTTNATKKRIAKKTKTGIHSTEHWTGTCPVCNYDRQKYKHVQHDDSQRISISCRMWRIQILRRMFLHPTRSDKLMAKGTVVEAQTLNTDLSLRRGLLSYCRDVLLAFQFWLPRTTCLASSECARRNPEPNYVTMMAKFPC